jgi:hypothetical protein
MREMERLIYYEVEFNDLGFQRPGIATSRILWSDIRRIAYGWECNEMALEDWNFWAFQTTSPEPILEVVIGSVDTMRFSDALRSEEEALVLLCRRPISCQ